MMSNDAPESGYLLTWAKCLRNLGRRRVLSEIQIQKGLRSQDCWCQLCVKVDLNEHNYVPNGEANFIQSPHRNNRLAASMFLCSCLSNVLGSKGFISCFLGQHATLFSSRYVHQRDLSPPRHRRRRKIQAKKARARSQLIKEGIGGNPSPGRCKCQWMTDVRCIHLAQR